MKGRADPRASAAVASRPSISTTSSPAISPSAPRSRQRLDQGAAPRDRRRTTAARSLHLPRRLAVVVRRAVPAQGRRGRCAGGAPRWRSTPSAPRSSRRAIGIDARRRRRSRTSCRRPRPGMAAGAAADGRCARRQRAVGPPPSRAASTPGARWPRGGRGEGDGRRCRVRRHAGVRPRGVLAPRGIERRARPSGGRRTAKRATSARCSRRSSATASRAAAAGRRRADDELPGAALVASAARRPTRAALGLAADRAGRGARDPRRRWPARRQSGAARDANARALIDSDGRCARARTASGYDVWPLLVDELRGIADAAVPVVGAGDGRSRRGARRLPAARRRHLRRGRRLGPRAHARGAAPRHPERRPAARLHLPPLAELPATRPTRCSRRRATPTIAAFRGPT